MTEYERKALALLESIDRSLAALMNALQAINETAEPLSPRNAKGWPESGPDPNEPADHRNLRRGEPWRRGEPHRWTR